MLADSYAAGLVCKFVNVFFVAELCSQLHDLSHMSPFDEF